MFEKDLCVLVDAHGSHLVDCVCYVFGKLSVNVELFVEQQLHTLIISALLRSFFFFG